MTLRIRLMLCAAVVAALPAAALASTGGDGQPATFSGSYLAGRSADQARDVSSAVRFYRQALQVDADNPALTERLLLLSLANGDMKDAFALARRLIGVDDTSPAGRLSLAVEALKSGQGDKAAAVLENIGSADLARLSAGLIEAWVQFGDGKVDDAVKTISLLTGPEWYKIFKDFHTAMILDAAGRTGEAATIIKNAYSDDTSALRIVTGYARIMARDGERDEAIHALTVYGGEMPRQPEVRELLNELRAGKTPAPIAATPMQGVAEALYGLGTAIGTDEGPELPAAYLRLAMYLDNGHYAATQALGDIFQSVDRCEDAIRIYDTIPRSAAMRRNTDIQTGACLATLDKPDEGAKYVKRVVDADPTDIEAAMELGNIYRADSRFAEAAVAYSKGVDNLVNPQKADWRIFYYRGVALERSKQWPQAEADFKRALELNPDQAQILNYLGYSWVDRGENLDEALDMIKKAVSLSPNDGYIVDSLGWAYHRLGRDDEAVRTLQNAIELRGGDATINDHIGDVLWKVGRKREAYFQWAHARDSEPEKDQLPLILAKLKDGLDGAAPALTEVAGSGGPLTSVTVGKGESLWTIAERELGDPEMYNRIFEANRKRIGDPNKIFPGMKLDIPSRTN